ncbi:MAG: CDP-diacylglycerol--serine O-phosphatidyltransferase [Bacteroidales bacterium]|jgi:CDP-diacylglycerol--serine O-phosphatidyltransferase|nr:CDP-diacylglycerol--serine O-phosphatidyltransferase [Bacteroidales bacterium]
MKYIPNSITLANLLCGCLSIVAVFSGQLATAGFLIFLAAIFDFLDGFAARLLKAYSDIGKELDSLADVVSFGVAPAMIAFQIILAQPTKMLFPQMPYIAFAMVLFSALRLAKFNIDTRQTDHFIGMPTPANALFWASLPLVVNDLHSKFSPETVKMLFHPTLMVVLCIVFAALLVVPLPMLSFKFKSTAFKPNWQRFVLVWLVLALYFMIGISAIPIGILIYPLLSLTLIRK